MGEAEGLSVYSVAAPHDATWNQFYLRTVTDVSQTTGFAFSHTGRLTRPAGNFLSATQDHANTPSQYVPGSPGSVGLNTTRQAPRWQPEGLITNGDFSGGYNSSTGITPGWSHMGDPSQGQPGQGIVRSGYLQLQLGGQSGGNWRMHNRLYVPADTVGFSFRIQVETPPTDRASSWPKLRLRLGDPISGTLLETSIATLGTGWITLEAPVPASLRGKTLPLTFELNAQTPLASTSSIVARVNIDDIKLWTSRPATAVLPAGLTGDLVTINLNTVAPGSNFGLDGVEVLVGSTYQTTTLTVSDPGIIRVLAANGTVLATLIDPSLIPGRSGFMTTGQLLLAPGVSGALTGDVSSTLPGFQGTFRFLFSSDGRPLQTTQRLDAGHSGSGINAVLPGTDTLSVLRRQQRLGYLGYVRPRLLSDGTLAYAPIALTGQADTDTRAATALFNGIAASTSSVSGTGNDLTPEALELINSSDAPRWGEFAASGINWINADGAENHDWGTSWSQGVITQAGNANNSGALIRTNDISLPAGGDTPAHAGHETGLDIDIQLVATNLQALTTGPWYTLSTAQSALGSSGTLWPMVASRSGGTLSAIQARDYAWAAAGITATATAWDVERLLTWLGAQISASALPNKAFADAIIATATAGASQFDRGLDIVAGKRADYDRTRTVQQVVALAVPMVRRIVLNDPIARRLAATQIPATVSLAQAEGCGDRIRVEVRRADTPLSRQALLALVDGANALADTLQGTESLGALGTPLPVVGATVLPNGVSPGATNLQLTLGQAGDGTTMVRQRLVNVITTYLNSTRLPTVEGLAASLRAAGSTVTVTVDDGFIQLDLGLQRTATTNRPLNLGVNAGREGLALSSVATVPFNTITELQTTVSLSRDLLLPADSA
ncbi:MAG: hypothetical protein EBS30_13260, partial [Planctomycetes bacterium]|nr:hypothetical protein [Planctomycetota bacterium]